MPEGFDNLPVFRKRMVLCTPFGPFINGKQKGDMTPERLRSLAENARRYPRNMRVYVGGDHVFNPDERVADGWIEGVEYVEWSPNYPNGALVGDVKLHGEGARQVAQDLIRGGSIGVREGTNPDNTPQGEVLDHFLISDWGFDKSVNIAIAATGGNATAYYFTATTKEPDMADGTKDPEKEKPPGDDKVAAKLQEQEGTIIALKAETLRKDEEIEALTEQLANARADVDKETALAENINLKRKDFLRDVRDMVNHGLKVGTIISAEVTGYGGAHPLDFTATERWFKASKFYDATVPNPEQVAFEVLKYTATKTKPRVVIGGSFRSGQPAGEGDAVTLTEDERKRMKDRGQNPDRIASLSDQDDFEEWKRKKAAASGGSR